MFLPLILTSHFPILLRLTISTVLPLVWFTCITKTNECIKRDDFICQSFVYTQILIQVSHVYFIFLPQPHLWLDYFPLPPASYVPFDTTSFYISILRLYKYWSRCLMHIFLSYLNLTCGLITFPPTCILRSIRPTQPPALSPRHSRPALRSGSCSSTCVSHYVFESIILSHVPGV